MFAQASPDEGFPQRAGRSAGVGEAERTGWLLLGMAQPPTGRGILGPSLNSSELLSSPVKFSS